MEQYNVTGMSCAACQARVEKAVSKVPGVESCAVSLLTNSMGVEGTATPDVIIKAVEAAGYGASVKGAKSSSPSKQEQEDALKEKFNSFRYISYCAYVFQHGTYDVGLASSISA